MANQKHLNILTRGVTAWNKWRERLPDQEPDLSGADLRRTNLRDAYLIGTNLSETNLSSANLCEANLSFADLTGADLSHAYLNRADLNEASLTYACLHDASLSDVYLGRAYLDDTDLSNARLSSADLSGAILSGARLNDASLSGARLRGTVLSWADLSGTDLSGADFSGARLDGANLCRAKIGWTTFANTDLSTVKGLETVIHSGPSTIGVDTLYRSQGKIPPKFLRDAGLPEVFLTYLPSLIAEPIGFHSCFISYSQHDDDFAQRLHSRMRREHLRVWYAPEDVRGGEKLHEQIFTAIQLHDKLLLVLSENSMKSAWVMTEIRRAKRVEREENRRKLFPIRLVDFETIRQWECFDADSGKDLAVEVREYYIPDFSNWKDHVAFESEFAKLLHALRAEGHDRE